MDDTSEPSTHSSPSKGDGSRDSISFEENESIGGRRSRINSESNKSSDSDGYRGDCSRDTNDYTDDDLKSLGGKDATRSIESPLR